MSIFVINIIFNLFSKLKRGTIVGIKKELKKKIDKKIQRIILIILKVWEQFYFVLIEEG